MTALKNGYTAKERKAPYENFFDVFNREGKIECTYTLSSDHVTLIWVYSSDGFPFQVEQFFKNDVELFRFIGVFEVASDSQRINLQPLLFG